MEDLEFDFGLSLVIISFGRRGSSFLAGGAFRFTRSLSWLLLIRFGVGVLATLLFGLEYRTLYFTFSLRIDFKVCLTYALLDSVATRFSEGCSIYSRNGCFEYLVCLVWNLILSSKCLFLFLMLCLWLTLYPRA